MDTDWTVVGSGPGMEEWKRFAKRKIVCVNAVILPEAQLYVSSDPMAVSMYADKARAVIPECLIGEDARRGLPIIGVPCRTVGMLAIHHAIKRGATDIILCGVDGFSPDQMQYMRGNRVCSRVGANENAAQWLRCFVKSSRIRFAAPGPLHYLVQDICSVVV
jgi:hypothetical protein